MTKRSQNVQRRAEGIKWVYSNIAARYTLRVLYGFILTEINHQTGIDLLTECWFIVGPPSAPLDRCSGVSCLITTCGCSTSHLPTRTPLYSKINFWRNPLYPGYMYIVLLPGIILSLIKLELIYLTMFIFKINIFRQTICNMHMINYSRILL